MRIEIPILVEPDVRPEGGGSIYRVRPLLFNGPDRSDRILATALAKLSAALEKDLNELGRRGEHEQVAALTYAPDVDLHWLDLRLDLRDKPFRGRFPLVTLREFDRLLAFTPSLDDLWFEVESRADLARRATEVFTRHFRAAARNRDGQPVRRQLATFEGKKKPWIALVELSLSTRRKRSDGKARQLALLDAAEPMDGDAELQSVGRCLDRLYPDQLSRAVCRDAAVDELARLLEAADMRPVLVVGPPMVGKTALIHECVFRKTKSRVEKGGPMYPPEENVWLLAPQRLISGMSYVGQWENRLLAILKQSRKLRHVLYFDDLLGLYHAGATSQSTLSVADVLKPYIERREVRLLAEATPEQLRILRERDRGFADLFHVVQVAEPSEEETVRILLSVSRGLEARHGVRFGLDVLPCVIELTRTWQAEHAFPGKAARWLNQLAVKHQAADADRDTVLGEFHATSGLQVAFADSNARLSRQEVLAGLQDRIIGQRQAVETMADVVSIAKARLNDPQRPLGALLFLGPTGVGKTECAKALANYLFSNPARLVRFDMNEFVSPQSVPRLVGTFDQPEGLLTGAVRREPFCVLLLDEIEKAHPDVFDLLLQILGEARLTDALGRTANFSSAVIIMTSNLGTRQAARDVGFAPAGESSGHVYRKAVEEFFRPEFLNRIDRIVPFDRLDRADLEQIAQGILADVAGRAGLSRRRCAIELAGDALAWLVERGCHRTLGARAMRRAVERDLVRPMARQLAAITPDTPTVLAARRWGESLAVRIVPLIEAQLRADLVRPEQLGDAKALLARARAAIDRLQAAYEIHRPPMQDASGRILPQYHWYLCVAEFLQETRGLSIALADAIDGPKWGRGAPLIHPRQARDRTSVSRRYGSPGRGILKEITAAHDVIDYVNELSAELAKRKAESEPESLMRLLLDRLALAHALAPEPDGWVSDRALVLIRSLREPSLSQRIVAENLIAKYGVIHPPWRTDAEEDNSVFGLEITHWRSAPDPKQRLRAWWQELLPDGDPGGHHDRHCMHVLLAEGFHAGRFLAYEQGTHLFTTADDRLEPLQVIVLPAAAGRSPGDVLLDALARHEAALLPSPDQPSVGARRGAGGEGGWPSDPLRWLPTVSLWCPNKFRTDLQNGMTETFLGENPSSPRDLMATLPLPPEFEDFR